MYAEMTARTGGFRGERGADTPTGNYKILYESLREGLEDGGEIAEALVGLGLDKTAAAEIGRGLTSGAISQSERDTQIDDDDDLIKPLFQREQWDNQ
jgi:hypothetical protein